MDGTPTANPNPVTAGQSVTINYTVKNVGDAVTLNASTTRIQIKPAGSTTAIADADFPLSSLNKNSSTARSSALNIPPGTAAGSYKVYIILDRYDVTGQTATGIANDDDTNFNLTIGESGAPDIVVDGTPTASPNPVKPGQTVTINYTVKNVGDAATLDTSTTRIQIKQTGSTVAIADGNFSLPSLNQNSSSARSSALSIPVGTAAGGYKVYIILDRYDVSGQTAAGIANDDDTNLDLTIGEGGAPGNFTLSAEPPQWANSAPLIVLRWSAAANAESYEVYRQENKIFPATGVFSGRTFTDNSGLTAGQSYSYYVVARNGLGTTTSNAINVTAGGPVALPDLEVVPGTLTFSPSSVVQGSELEISFEVRNKGNAGAIETETRFRLSSDLTLTSGDSPLSPLDVALPAVGAGEVIPVSVRLRVPVGTTAGVYYPGLFLDRDDGGRSCAG